MFQPGWTVLNEQIALFSFTSMAPAVIYNAANANTTHTPALHKSYKGTNGNIRKPSVGTKYIVEQQTGRASS